MVEKAVEGYMKKKAGQTAQTALGEGMKAAGLKDIKELLGMFGVTPSVMENAMGTLIRALDAYTAAKFGGGTPGAMPSPGPHGGPSMEPSAPRAGPKSAQAPAQAQGPTPEALYEAHLRILKYMASAYGDLPLPEAVKRFESEKEEVIAALGGRAPVPAKATPAPEGAPAPAPAKVPATPKATPKPKGKGTPRPTG